MDPQFHMSEEEERQLRDMEMGYYGQGTPSMDTLTRIDAKAPRTTLEVLAEEISKLLPWYGYGYKTPRVRQVKDVTKFSNSPCYDIIYDHLFCFGHQQSHPSKSRFERKFHKKDEPCHETTVGDETRPTFVLRHFCNSTDVRQQIDATKMRQYDMEVPFNKFLWLRDAFPDLVSKPSAFAQNVITDYRAPPQPYLPSPQSYPPPPPVPTQIQTPPLISIPVIQPTITDKKIRIKELQQARDTKRRVLRVKRNAKLSFDFLIQQRASLPDFGEWKEEQKDFWASAFKTFSDEAEYKRWTGSDLAVIDSDTQELEEKQYKLGPDHANEITEAYADLVEDGGLCVDPVFGDIFARDCWINVVPAEERSLIRPYNREGGCLIYDTANALWRKEERKASFARFFEIFSNSMNANIDRFTFTKKSLKPAFQRKLANSSCYHGGFDQWISRFSREALERDVNTTKWLIPIEEKKVYVAANGMVIPRTKDHLFDKESKFKYLSDYKTKTGVINDTNNRKVFFTYLTKVANGEEELHADTAISMIVRLFPNAYKFMSHLFQDPNRQFAYFLRLGASLTGHCFSEALFIPGPARSGKSRHVSALQSIIGSWCKFMDFSAFSKSTHVQPNSHSSHLMPLIDSRLIVVDECSKSVINCELLKKVITHNPMPIRDVGEKAGDARVFPVFLIVILNPKDTPRFGIDDDSIRRRITVLESRTKTFDDHSRAKPQGYDKKDWKDQMVGNTYWMYAGKDEETFSQSFQRQYRTQSSDFTHDFFGPVEDTEEENTNPDELGTFMCVMASAAYILSRAGTQELPKPSEMIGDTDKFLRVHDIFGDFIESKFYVINRTASGKTQPMHNKTLKRLVKESGCTLNQVYKWFVTYCESELGQKHCPTHETFKDYVIDRDLLEDIDGQKYLRLTQKKSMDTKVVVATSAPVATVAPQTQSQTAPPQVVVTGPIDKMLGGKKRIRSPSSDKEESE